MATGFDALVTSALLARAESLGASLSLPVAMPNVVFPPPGQVRPDVYLAAYLMRTTIPVGIAAWDEHAGILQIDVMYKPQNGEVKPVDIACSVSDYFKRGTRVTSGSAQADVYDPPAIGNAMPDGDYTKVPVSIRFRSFVK